MKIKNKRLSFAAIALIAVVAVLCVILPKDGGKFVLTAKAQNLMAGIRPQSVDESNAVSEKFIASTQNFSVNLFKQTYKSGENTLVSPASACLALGMTANGASGSTLTAFQTVLGKYGMTVDDLNKAYKAYADELTEKRGNTTVSIANSIWYRTGFSADRGFLQNNADYFGAAARNLDFDDKNSVDVINNWVKNNTGNKIDKIIDRLDGNEVMHLIDAVYFEAKWENPFDTEAKPYGGTFRPDDGGTSQATYMNLETDLDYIKGTNETAVLLPYDDERYEMLCILPDNGIKLNDYIKGMTEKTIPDLISKKVKSGLTLNFPQFKVTSDNRLNSALKNMGLGVAFDSEKADFSKMSTDREKLDISAVQQKTFLQVDELGTQAGAVTDVAMNKSCVMPTVKFNRPFVYAVIDTQTNIPLFLGAMEKPESTLAAE